VDRFNSFKEMTLSTFVKGQQYKGSLLPIITQGSQSIDRSMRIVTIVHGVLVDAWCPIERSDAMAVFSLDIWTRLPLDQLSLDFLRCQIVGDGASTSCFGLGRSAPCSCSLYLKHTHRRCYPGKPTWRGNRRSRCVGMCTPLLRPTPRR
jgi:hypothetical protein